MNTSRRVLLLTAVAFFALFLCPAQENTKDATTPQQSGKGAVTMLTEADFYKKIADIRNNPNEFNYLGNRPCVIDFYADWCGPCRMLSPTLEALSKEYVGKVDFYKINVDNERNLAAAFGIRSIPTLLFIPTKGKPTLMQGALPKKELKETIDELLLDKKAQQ